MSIKSQNVTKKTLDTQHVNKIQEFQDRGNTVSQLQKEIEDLTEQAAKMKEQRLSDSEFDEYMCICDKITDAKRALEKFEKHNDEVDYYVNTASILFQYYDILENGKEAGNAPKTSGKSILKYFVPQDNNAPKDNAPVIDRATLLEKYMHVTDNNHIRTMETEARDKCPHCDSADRNVMLHDGLIYCNTCSTVEYIIVDHERPSYKDPPKEIRVSKRLGSIDLLESRFLKVQASSAALVACAA